ncbi:MAG TPA: PIN domain-containing protein, partial [Thermoanaerobaculia bacterium]|nr:PIN domain-containing protein [Thermoanaerobaculia bacterium]
HQSIDGLTRHIAVMPFDDECATQFARIANDLAARGTPIGDFDALIAAHAMALDVTLVTNNVKHFSLVRGLKLENWL